MGCLLEYHPYHPDHPLQKLIVVDIIQCSMLNPITIQNQLDGFYLIWTYILTVSNRLGIGKLGFWIISKSLFISLQ